MTRKIKTQVINNQQIDIEDLITRVAKAVAKELASEFSKRPVNLGEYPTHTQIPQTIDIDESIIPAKLDIEIANTNIQSKVSKEKTIDKNLTESKNKLASILKKNK